MLNKIKQPQQGFKVFLSLPVVMILFLTFSINGDLFSQNETTTKPIKTTKETKSTTAMTASQKEAVMQLAETPKKIENTASIKKQKTASPPRNLFPPNAIPGNCYTLIDKATNTWITVVCPANMSQGLLDQVNSQLKAKGYTIDPILTIGSSGFKLSKTTVQALCKYQKDNNIHVGNLTIESIESLGITLTK